MSESENSNIPKIIMQTSVHKQPEYIIDIIKSKCPGWDYIHFTDDEIIKYFQENPIDEFPNISDIFKSFSKGQHKADLFRYYFLYLNGGIFLDSDAIFEVNIDEIIENYDNVFIRSFMKHTGFFNGFIATYKKCPIIYDALKNAYNTENSTLKGDYFYFCKELFKAYESNNKGNIKIYEESLNSERNVGFISDSDNNKLLSHHFHYKKIPNPDV
tara:strand:- start:9721 stop:10362 length:642 start_codon:yes stop_codon:yes gene_type:complete